VDAIQRARTFRGYEEIKADARQIATLLRGETARYDHDVVIAGNFGAFPVVVRFSQDANTPGLILQMTAPATFDLQLSPKTAPEVSGKTAIKTGMVGLDTRFNASTGQAVQAKVFVTDPAVGGQMEQLCCSSQTFLVIESGGIELTEMLIPVDTARHVRNHMVAMEALARSLERMPGADSHHALAESAKLGDTGSDCRGRDRAAGFDVPAARKEPGSDSGKTGAGGVIHRRHAPDDGPKYSSPRELDHGRRREFFRCRFPVFSRPRSVCLRSC
jgi:hypothetical protein